MVTISKGKLRIRYHTFFLLSRVCVPMANRAHIAVSYVHILQLPSCHCSLFDAVEAALGKPGRYRLIFLAQGRKRSTAISFYWHLFSPTLYVSFCATFKLTSFVIYERLLFFNPAWRIILKIVQACGSQYLSLLCGGGGGGGGPPPWCGCRHTLFALVAWP